MKILVNISVPAISQQFDVFVPDNLRIQTLITMLAETVEELSGQRYVASRQECLCSVEKNILLRKSMSLEHYGIRSGDHLSLI